jgi:hypothetical protein
MTDTSHKPTAMVPDWWYCSEQVVAGKANALETFIYKHQPTFTAAAEDRLEWREDLQALLEELILAFGQGIAEAFIAHEQLEESFRQVKQEFDTLKSDLDNLMEKRRP